MVATLQPYDTDTCELPRPRLNSRVQGKSGRRHGKVRLIRIRARNWDQNRQRWISKVEQRKRERFVRWRDSGSFASVTPNESGFDERSRAGH